MENFVKTYRSLPYDIAEIRRYCGVKTEDEATEKLINECVKEADGVFSYNVAYKEFPITEQDGKLNFGFASTSSEKLRINLKNCIRVVVFCATVGIGVDRLIRKYSSVSPSKALVFQSIGAERIESLCDAFCNDLKEKYGKENAFIQPRFSPGYGDLPLSFQRDIFNALSPEKFIGVTLNSSFQMSPSKSVTAIVGVGGSCAQIARKCEQCNKTDCVFRS